MTGLAMGGAGVSQAPDGRVAFVAGAFPGDRVRPLSVHEHRRHLEVDAFALVERSPDRTTPVCPWAEDAGAGGDARPSAPGRCGGCAWMALELGAQRRHKAALVEDALRRLGGVTLPGPPPVHAGAASLGYRGRVRFHIDPDGVVGLHARGSHALVAIEACAVASPAVNAALAALRRAALAHPEAPGGAARAPRGRSSALGAFSEVEIRVAPAGPPVLYRLVPRDRERGLSRAARALLAALAEGAVVAVEGEPEPPGERQRWPLPGGVELHAPPAAFTQVNPAVNAPLVAAVVAGAAARGARRFVDLFAGAGNFALALAASGLEGVAVESEGAALRGARAATTAAGLDGRLTLMPGDAPRILGRLLRGGAAWDLAVVDPPRAGALEVVRALAAAGIPHLALVSCEPPTLARDLGALREAGYRVTAVECFDFFPHTPHVETLAWVTR